MTTDLVSDASRPDQVLLLLQHVLALCRSSDLEVALRIAKQYANRCNLLSLSSSDSTAKLLRAAETLITSVRMRISKEAPTTVSSLYRVTLLTYNNFANLHKSKRNYHKALTYLMRANKLIPDISSHKSLGLLDLCAKTHLNTSALYADLRRYSESITYAEQCLAILQEQLKGLLTGKPLSALSGKEQEKTEALMKTYIAAFVNIGKAREAMTQTQLAIQAYTNAYSIATKFLSNDSPEVHSLTQTLSRFQRKQSEEVPSKPQTRPYSATPSSKPLLRDKNKYYSQERLIALHKRLNQGVSGLKLVTADQFFLKKITANLNVSRDVPHLRSLSTYPPPSNDLLSAQKQELQDRRLLSTLRQRRHPYHPHSGLIHGKELVTAHISRIEKELEAVRKRKEVRAVSRATTKAFQSVSKKLLFETAQQCPKQRK